MNILMHVGYYMIIVGVVIVFNCMSVKLDKLSPPKGTKMVTIDEGFNVCSNLLEGAEYQDGGNKVRVLTIQEEKAEDERKEK